MSIHEEKPSRKVIRDFLQETNFTLEELLVDCTKFDCGIHADEPICPLYKKFGQCLSFSDSCLTEARKMLREQKLQPQIITKESEKGDNV